MDLPPEATDRVFGDSMLEMELLHLGGQLSGTLAYNTGLFRESTAERVASQFQVGRPPSWVSHPHCTVIVSGMSGIAMGTSHWHTSGRLSCGFHL